MLLCRMPVFTFSLLTEESPPFVFLHPFVFQASGMNKKYYSVLLSCLVTSGSYCHSIHFKSGKEENLENIPLTNHFLDNYDEDRKQSCTYFLALTASVLTQLHYMKKSMKPDVEIQNKGDI